MRVGIAHHPVIAGVKAVLSLSKDGNLCAYRYQNPHGDCCFITCCFNRSLPLRLLLLAWSKSSKRSSRWKCFLPHEPLPFKSWLHKSAPHRQPPLFSPKLFQRRCSHKLYVIAIMSINQRNHLITKICDSDNPRWIAVKSPERSEDL